jgi:uncharacterized HAD superfamily protein
MKLGFDIDGIVANMAATMVGHINEAFNLNHTEDVFVNHQIFNNEYVDDPEENDKISTSIYDNVIHNVDTLRILKPHEDAVEAIRRLAKYGHSIHFITARSKSQHSITVEWIRKNLIPFNTIHSVGKDGNRGNVVSKGQQARALNLDFFIDDDPANLPDFYRYKKRWRKGVALFTRPWNVNESVDGSRFLRFDNWIEVIRHLGINKR